MGTHFAPAFCARLDCKLMGTRDPEPEKVDQEVLEVHWGRCLPSLPRSQPLLRILTLEIFPLL